MTRVLAAWAGLALLVAWAPPALAAGRSVTLSVKMWWASCSFIVKRSLERVAGVFAVRVSYRGRSAVVRYDDDRTSVAALTAATAKAGCPAASVAAD